MRTSLTATYGGTGSRSVSRRVPSRRRRPREARDQRARFENSGGRRVRPRSRDPKLPRRCRYCRSAPSRASPPLLTSRPCRLNPARGRPAARSPPARDENDSIFAEMSTAASGTRPVRAARKEDAGTIWLPPGRAAAICLLILPQSTISEIWTVAASVTRRPSMNVDVVLRRLSISPICGLRVSEVGEAVPADSCGVGTYDAVARASSEVFASIVPSIFVRSVALGISTSRPRGGAAIRPEDRATHQMSARRAGPPPWTTTGRTPSFCIRTMSCAKHSAARSSDMAWPPYLRGRRPSVGDGDSSGQPRFRSYFRGVDPLASRTRQGQDDRHSARA